MTKTELHEVVDALPGESLPAAAILLRRAQDPVIAKLDAAPYDDKARQGGHTGHPAGAERTGRPLV